MPSVASETSSIASQYSQAALRTQPPAQDPAQFSQDQAGPSPFAMLLDTPVDAKPPAPAPRPDRSDPPRDSQDDAPPADAQKADSSGPAKDASDAKAGAAQDGKDAQDAKDAKVAQATDGKDAAKKADAGKDKKAADTTAVIAASTDAIAAAAAAADAAKQAAANPVAAVVPVVPVAVAAPVKAATDAEALAAVAAAAGPGGPKAADAKPVQAKGDAPAKTAAPTTQTPDGAQIEAAKDADAGAAADATDKAPDHHAAAEKLLTAGLDAAAPSGPAGDAAAAANTSANAAQNLAVQGPANQTGTAAAQATAAANAANPALAPVPVAGLAVEIATQATAGNNHFAIRLDPPELGRIDVHLDVDSGGNITTHVVADRAATLDLLRRDSQQLERSLQDAGLKTGDNSMQFSLRDQSFAGRDDRGNFQNAAHLVVPEDNAAPLEAMRQGYGRLLGLGGGVDIRI